MPLLLPLASVPAPHSPPFHISPCPIQGVKNQGEAAEASRQTKMGIPTHLLPEAIASVVLIIGLILHVSRNQIEGQL